jgi:hypothetical protein
VYNNPLSYTDPSGYVAVASTRGHHSGGSAAEVVDTHEVIKTKKVIHKGVVYTVNLAVRTGSTDGDSKVSEGAFSTNQSQGASATTVALPMSAAATTTAKGAATRTSLGAMVGRALGLAIGLLTYSPELADGMLYTPEQIDMLTKAHEAGLAYAAGQIRNNNGKKTVLIGENQNDRVIPAAEYYKSQLIGAPRAQRIQGKIQPGSFNEMRALTYNVGWVLGFKAANYTFLDIGIDNNRAERSVYYEAEKFTLGDYPRVRQVPWP